MNPAAEQHSSTTVSFEAASPQAPLILVNVRVNRQGPFRFVLDTGAGSSGLSRALAGRLNVATGKPLEAQGCGGSAQVSSARVQEVSVGPLSLAEPLLFVADLSAISNKVGTEIDGILGFDFLHRWRVLIDYPQKTVTFFT